MLCTRRDALANVDSGKERHNIKLADSHRKIA